jgi:hypothetical protein
MTYEQFYFWLKGYMDCMQNKKANMVDDIETSMQTVVI